MEYVNKTKIDTLKNDYRLEQHTLRVVNKEVLTSPE